MGNKVSSFSSYKDFSIFQSSKISQYENGQIQSLYIDNEQLPNSGLLIVGKQCNPIYFWHFYK